MTEREAHQEIQRLVSEHRLGFVYNPGGSEFTGKGFRCQVDGMSAVEDLAKLQAALASQTQS